MRFSDHALARRLERAEGHACAQFAEARRRLCPDSSSAWMEFSGAYAVFDGIGSPVFEHGCDLAMMVAEAGSDSQRNAERKGFQIAYTRIQWRLS